MQRITPAAAAHPVQRAGIGRGGTSTSAGVRRLSTSASSSDKFTISHSLIGARAGGGKRKSGNVHDDSSQQMVAFLIQNSKLEMQARRDEMQAEMQARRDEMQAQLQWRREEEQSRRQERIASEQLKREEMQMRRQETQAFTMFMMNILNKTTNTTSNNTSTAETTNSANYNNLVQVRIEACVLFLFQFRF